MEVIAPAIDAASKLGVASLGSAFTPACHAAQALLSQTVDYTQLVDTILNAWSNQVAPFSSTDCAAKAKPCHWVSSSKSSRCLNNSEWTFKNTNATVCTVSAFMQWVPFVYVVNAMEKAGNATLGRGGLLGGRNWWIDLATAAESSSSPPLIALQSLKFSRPVYLPVACTNHAADLTAIIRRLDAECRAAATSAVVYCNVSKLQPPPDMYTRIVNLPSLHLPRRGRRLAARIHDRSQSQSHRG